MGKKCEHTIGLTGKRRVFLLKGTFLPDDYVFDYCPKCGKKLDTEK